MVSAQKPYALGVDQLERKNEEYNLPGALRQTTGTNESVGSRRPHAMTKSRSSETARSGGNTSLSLPD